MYVKSLTLRGFKSFASATTMRLEPGITCIVGPNGSGKSNVVDALAWVMGEQGAKSLRGGKMEDVIFAGTSGRNGRPPLGRAEVALTIDNSDGALPIDYTEVTISRTMFRSGISEYAINGTACRLLDVQELLADSGIGREMHVIVGQGQLDAVLRATPEERRGFIEEAAGVLKHRKRKERALRKIDAMDVNLTRVTDLVGELRRQLGPLGRQAEAARRAAAIQAEARDARLRLLADDLAQLTSALEQELADEAALVQRRANAERVQVGLRERWAALEADAAHAAPALAAAQERWYALCALRDRLRATGSLAAERVRLLGQEAAEQATAPGRDPDQLRAEAQRVRERERSLLAEIAQATVALDAAVAQRCELEARYAAEQDRVARLGRAAADRREGLARLTGQVAAQTSRVESGQAELARLAEAHAAGVARSAAAEREFATLESTVAVDEDGEEGLDAAYESAVAAQAHAQDEVEALREQERLAERDRAAASARLEALEVSLRHKDGAAALLADGHHGLLGSVSHLLDVDDGCQVAVAAGLGWAADAVVVATLAQARDAVRALRDAEAGRAGLLVADPVGVDASAAAPVMDGLPPACVPALAVVRPAAAVQAPVRRLLAATVVVPDADTAMALVAARPDLVAVTRDGDLYAAGLARGGSAASPSLIETRSALDHARDAEQEARYRGERARFALAAATQHLAGHASTAQAALERLNESDARLAAVAERLGELGVVVRSARSEADRAQAAITATEQRLSADAQALEELQRRLADAQAVPAEDADTGDDLPRLAALLSTARSVETEQRLVLRTREERIRAVAERAAGLETAARNEVQQRQRAADRAARRARETQVARAVVSGAAYTVEVVSATVETAGRQRTRAEQARSERDAALTQLRGRLAEVDQELRELTDSVHADEMARTQQRLRIEALRGRAMDELGIDPQDLLEEFGPHREVPRADGEPGTPYVREVQQRRLRSAERQLTQLGQVNPLALEEFAALEERHRFLTEQLDDLKRSRRDLLEIVTEVDERVRQVFVQAYEDTAAQFEVVFSRLFPGGEGRLYLTNPDDLLATGIEVEARPPGKKVKRLSLLSGGERSLTAVALLVAIFKARPSPFYVMDEVEAALDDTNLGRLLTLFEELRESSQLIVITHQKRTMEIADALYGVSMRGDGVTTLVSQRLRDSVSA